MNPTPSNRVNAPHRLSSHGLYLNLESLWDDYVQSVDHFIDSLDQDDDRRAVALERWHGLQWSVQMVTVPTTLPMTLPSPVGYTASAASVSSSISSLGPVGDDLQDDPGAETSYSTG